MNYDEETLIDILLEMDDETNKFFDDNIVMEARVNSTPTAARGKQAGLVGMLIQFFKKIFDKFHLNTKSLIEKNNAWLKSAQGRLDSIKTGGLQLSLDMNYLKSQDNVRKFTNGSLYGKLTDKNMYANEDLIKRVFKIDTPEELTMTKFIQNPMFGVYVSKNNNGSLAEGSKQYFRYGNAGYTQNPKQLNAGEMNLVAREAIKYCLNYEPLSRELIRMQSKIQELLQYIENNIGKGVTESVIMSLTESYAEFFALMEADNNNQSQKPQFDTGSSIGKEDPRYKREAGADRNFEDEQRESKQQEDKYGKYSQLQLKYTKLAMQCLQILISSALTVSEERYITYMKILRYLMKDKSVVNKETDITGGRKGKNADVIDKSKTK